MAISKKLIKEIKEHVNIVDLAGEYFEMTRKNGYLGIIGEAENGGDYSSLVIYPKTNSYYRQSTGTGGDVISFVQETGIEGITSFKDAVKFLQGRIDPDFKADMTFQKKKSYEEMSLSERAKKLNDCHAVLTGQFKFDNTYRNAMAYLIQERKIDPDIVKEGIKKGEIAQIIVKDKNGQYSYRQVAFISKEMGKYSCINRRSFTANSSFKGDLSGCNYDYGWRVFPEDAKTKGISPEAKIYCFEGYIDMLSYKTLARMQDKDLSKDIFIVCGSANKYKCVVNAAREYKKDVVICFDNDTAGKKMGDVLKEKLADIKTGDEPITVIKEFSKAKDWNDDLKRLYVQKSLTSEIKTSKGMRR